MPKARVAATSERARSRAAWPWAPAVATWGVTLEVYKMPVVEGHGEIASMEGMGPTAWSKDGEVNTMCIDQVSSGR